MYSRITGSDISHVRSVMAYKDTILLAGLAAGGTYRITVSTVSQGQQGDSIQTEETTCKCVDVRKFIHTL